MNDSIGVDLSKIIKDERNNEDTGCRRMSRLLALHALKLNTIVVCVDAVMASNGGHPVDIDVLMSLLPRYLASDYFLNKPEFQGDEILGHLNDLAASGIFRVEKSTHLVGFRKDLDPSMLIEQSLEFVKKTINAQADRFTEWLSHICEGYSVIKEFKMEKQSSLKKPKVK